MATYASTVLGDHPLVYYRLDDGGCCAAVDSSGNGLNGIFGATAVSYGSPGLIAGDANTAVTTDGTATPLTRDPAALPSTGARTVELWEQTTNTSWQTLYSYGSFSLNGAFFELSIRPDVHGTTLLFVGGNDDAAFLTPQVVDDGRPHQIALTYDGSAVVTFYVDGQQVGQTSLVAPLNTDLGGQALKLGNGLDGAFRGSLDEFALYNATLTPDQLNAHWRAGTAATACPAAPTSGYAAAVASDHPYRYFRLGESGQAATDHSGNCRFAAYAGGVSRVPGLLTADADTAIASASPATNMLSAAVDGSPSAGARTLEFWEQTTNTSWQTLFSYGALGPNGAYFGLSIRPDVHGTVLQFIGWNDDAAFYSPYVINDGFPHQVVLSYDGSGVVTFYVDGQQIGQASVATPLNTNVGSQPLVLGNGLDGAFNGVLDELSLYPAALSAAQVSAHYAAGAVPPGYAVLAGTVLAGGSGLAGAHAEACPTAGGACFSGRPTGPAGLFQVIVPAGSYSLTAFPPAGSQYLTPKTVGPYSVPPSTTNITIVFITGLPPGGSFSSPGGGTTSGTVPIVNWAQPSTYTVSGCRGGFGVLMLESVNTSTGQPQTQEVRLVETPAGSGTYVAHIPALAPLHGLTSVSQMIACPGHTSVLPDGGRPAGGTALLLAGSGLTGATGVLFGTSPAASFQVLSDSVVKAVSPAGTGTVTISITTASGGTQVIGDYTYLEVSAISPNSGPSAGGTSVTITGQGFTNVKGVIFGLLPAASFSVLSPTQIQAVSPAGLGTVDIQVVNSFALTDAVDASLYTYTGGPPGSSSINEGTGPNAPQNLSAQILSSGFCTPSEQAANTTNIEFGRMCHSAQFIVMEEGPIGIFVGAFLTSVLAAIGIVAVIIDIPVLVSATLVVLSVLGVILLIIAVWDFFNMLLDPDGTVMDASGNPIAGAVATLAVQAGGSFVPMPAGTGLILPATNPETTDATGAFQWDAITGTYVVRASKSGCYAPGDAGQSTVSTPPFFIPPPAMGLILTLECPGSTAPAPTVTGVAPNLGVSAGGTRVAISGTGLAGNPSVHFGSTPAASVTVLSPYSILAIAPAGSSTVDVTVTTAGGTSTTGAASKYDYFTAPTTPGAPSITSVSPGNGPQAGGNLVRIVGTGLAGTFGVSFGGFSVVQVTNVSASEVDAVVPAGAGDGPVNIVVAGPSGVSAPSPAATYTYGTASTHATSTSLSSSANPSVYGAAITLTAAVTASAGGTPTGAVTFAETSTGNTLCAASPLAGGSASCLSSGLSAGSHALSATYAGGGSFSGSAGNLIQVVMPAPLSVSANNSSRYFGQANPAFAGTITGIQGGDDITATHATAATAASPAGTYPIVPTLADPSNKLGNYSLTVNNGTLTILPVPTATAIASSLNPSLSGLAVNFTATVTATVGAPNPTANGSVSFKDGGTLLSTVPLAGGKATFTTSSLTPGHHTVTASFSGDGNYLASTSAGLIQAVRANRIAFASLRTGRSQIFVMNADGSGQVQVTRDAWTDTQPNLSPDGTRIAYVGAPNGNAQVFVINSSGQNETRLTTGPAIDNSPVWSPDGTQIVFSSNRSGRFQLYVMNAAGSNLKLLVADAFNDTTPTWSPDGGRLAFTCFRNLLAQLCVVNRNGSGEAGLTKDSFTNLSPAWSPDGSRIAFSSTRSGLLPAIYWMRPDGSGITRLTNDPGAIDATPTWSPDGMRIAFSTTRSGSVQIDEIGADGTGHTLITSGGTFNGLPSWTTPLSPG